MLELMEKVRLVLKVEEEVRDALKLESAISGKYMVDIIEELIRENFPEALSQIRTRRAQKEKAAKKNKE